MNVRDFKNRAQLVTYHDFSRRKKQEFQKQLRQLVQKELQPEQPKQPLQIQRNPTPSVQPKRPKINGKVLVCSPLREMYMKYSQKLRSLIQSQEEHFQLQEKQREAETEDQDEGLDCKFEDLYNGMRRVLELYQRREEDWLNERAILENCAEELERAILQDR